jgi:hypothetical protein
LPVAFQLNEKLSAFANLELIQRRVDGLDSVRLVAMEIISGLPKGMLGVLQLLGSLPNERVMMPSAGLEIKMGLVVSPDIDAQIDGISVRHDRQNHQSQNSQAAKQHT